MSNQYTKVQERTIEYLKKYNIKINGDITKYSYQNKNEDIQLICGNDHSFTSNLQTINVNRSKGRGTSCYLCKSDQLKEKKEKDSGYNIIEEDEIISCKKCGLKYHYSNLHMNCFCELKIKKKEHLFYKELMDECDNNFRIIREYRVEKDEKSSKKFDIYMENDEVEVFIEIDDKQHYYPSSERYEKDKKWSRYILNDHDSTRRIVLLRINDELIEDNQYLKNLVFIISERIQTSPEQKELIIVKKDREYDFITNEGGLEDGLSIYGIRPAGKKIEIITVVNI